MAKGKGIHMKLLLSLNLISIKSITMRGVNPCKLNQIIMMSYLVMNMISRLT
jgi:hypothetical protein